MVAHSTILAWENPMDKGAWRVIAHAVTKELDMTEQLSNNCKYTETISILKSFQIRSDQSLSCVRLFATS